MMNRKGTNLTRAELEEISQRYCIPMIGGELKIDPRVDLRELLNRSKRTIKKIEKENDDLDLKLKSHGPLTYSGEFRYIKFHDKPYSPTPNQARVLEVLFRAQQNRYPEVAIATLLEKADIKSKSLVHVFRGKNLSLLGKLIVPGNGKGTHKLDLAPKSSATKIPRKPHR